MRAGDPGGGMVAEGVEPRFLAQGWGCSGEAFPP